MRASEESFSCVLQTQLKVCSRPSEQIIYLAERKALGIHPFINFTAQSMNYNRTCVVLFCFFFTFNFILLLLVNKAVDLSSLWVREGKGASEADETSPPGLFFCVYFHQMARNEEMI